MRLRYISTTGAWTFARWPSLALHYWLGESRPRSFPADPEPLVLYQVGPPLAGDTSDVFLTLVWAECEARWNQAPPVAPLPPRAGAGPPPGGAAYQDCCLAVLRWLEGRGAIRELLVEAGDHGPTAAEVERMLRELPRLDRHGRPLSPPGGPDA